MNWNDWYKHYDSLPNLQERLRIVQEQIVLALDGCAPGAIQIVSVCAGDGRDLLGALQNHPRRDDVAALLLDNNAESVARGQAAAENAGLGGKVRFVEADATLAKNYLGAVPADLVLLSGFLGHLRHEDVPKLIGSLPMFCKPGGMAIWNRHLVMHKGNEQVPAIREFFKQAKFEELFFETTAADGFAVGRSRFNGQSAPLDTTRVLFEFVGLDRLLSVDLPSPAKSAETGATALGETNGDAALEILAEAETSLPARFGRMVELHPAHPAISSGAWQPTYSELNSTANRLAHTLIKHGGASGDRVALLLRHDAPLIATALAVLKTGRIVVVLNPTEPLIRLKQILDDAQPNLIVTDATNRDLAERIVQPGQTIIHFENQPDGPAHNPGIKIAPGDTAWLIYTSGSTGNPKGVIQTHRNIAHNIHRLSQGMKLTAADRIILLGSPSGGQGVATTWCALLNGATLCPFPAVERGVTGLKEWMTEHQITVYVSSASIFRHFVKTLADTDHLPGVRLVRFGSETSTASDFAAFQKHFSNQCILVNTLSSSETGNVTQHHFAHDAHVAAGRLPVGRAVTGVEIRLLDEQGREVRSGEVGEIVVRSRYLSPGYWRNEALTAERFFGNAGDIRMFRSGDLGRRGADGSLVFMDRKDTRVKVRGYRIEVAEIENILTQQDEVEGAVVSVRAAPNGDAQLVAHVVLRAGRKVTADTLRRALRATLPTYMVPASFVFLNKFPLTPHGKIDRQALPPPARERKLFPRFRSKPRDSFESRLTRIWESVLGISPIGRRDNFFDLGGTSLHSVEVLLHIEETFNVNLPPAILLEHSTIEALAVLLTGQAIGQSAGQLVLLRDAPEGRPLFFIHNGKGDVSSYGLLTRQLPGRPIYGLQSVGLNGESWPLMTVPAMAERYLQEVIKADPTGPYLLASTCMGGFVAFEMAQQLVQQGRAVGMVMLIDTSPPFSEGKSSRRMKLAVNSLRDAVRILRGRIIRHVGLKQSLRWLPAYRRFVSGMNARASHLYQFRPYAGTLTLVLTTEFPKNDNRLLMERYASSTQRIIISSSRSELFRPPAVDELARQMRDCLEQAEKTAAGPRL